MPVVKGDRIAESQRLNRCSVEASDFFGSLVAHEVPDDFGRFRHVAHLVHGVMYPRREPTETTLRRVRRLMDELRRAGLWRTWEVDGVMFAEVYKWVPRGNLVHRTPEPPAAPGWPVHHHARRCCTTAHARAREWGDLAGVEWCVSIMNGLPGGRPERPPEREGERDPERVGGDPFYPFVPFVPTNTDPPPPPPPTGGGQKYDLPAGLADEHGPPPNGTDPLSPAAERKVVDDVRRYAVKLGYSVSRRLLRRWKELVHGGHSREQLQHVIDEQNQYKRRIEDGFF